MTGLLPTKLSDHFQKILQDINDVTESPTKGPVLSIQKKKIDSLIWMESFSQWIKNMNSKSITWSTIERGIDFEYS